LAVGGEVFDTNPETFYERTVASTWEASIREAGAKAASATPMLAMAAYIAPDAIPRSLFAVLVEGEGPRQRKALADAFGSLHRFSLAEVSGDSISVHRLVQKVVRDGAEARSDSTRPLAALKALCETFPRDPALPAGWPVCEQLLAQTPPPAIASSWFPREGDGMATPSSRVSRVLMTGPLTPFADHYAFELSERGYTARTAVNQLR